MIVRIAASFDNRFASLKLQTNWTDISLRRVVRIEASFDNQFGSLKLHEAQTEDILMKDCPNSSFVWQPIRIFESSWSTSLLICRCVCLPVYRISSVPIILLCRTGPFESHREGLWTFAITGSTSSNENAQNVSIVHDTVLPNPYITRGFATFFSFFFPKVAENWSNSNTFQGNKSNNTALPWCK